MTLGQHGGIGERTLKELKRDIVDRVEAGYDMHHAITKHVDGRLSAAHYDVRVASTGGIVVTSPSGESVLYNSTAEDMPLPSTPSPCDPGCDVMPDDADADASDAAYIGAVGALIFTDGDGDGDGGGAVTDTAAGANLTTATCTTNQSDGVHHATKNGPVRVIPEESSDEDSDEEGWATRSSGRNDTGAMVCGDAGGGGVYVAAAEAMAASTIQSDVGDHGTTDTDDDGAAAEAAAWLEGAAACASIRASDGASEVIAIYSSDDDFFSEGEWQESDSAISATGGASKTTAGSSSSSSNNNNIHGSNISISPSVSTSQATDASETVTKDDFCFLGLAQPEEEDAQSAKKRRFERDDIAEIDDDTDHLWDYREVDVDDQTPKEFAEEQGILLEHLQTFNRYDKDAHPTGHKDFTANAKMTKGTTLIVYVCSYVLVGTCNSCLLTEDAVYLLRLRT
jgi:hypothetical protein